MYMYICILSIYVCTHIHTYIYIYIYIYMHVSVWILYIYIYIYIYWAEREGLTDVELVHRIHGHYFDVLMNLIEKRHRGNHGSILVGLIQLLPSITSLNGEQKGVMDNFSVENVPSKFQVWCLCVCVCVCVCVYVCVCVCECVCYFIQRLEFDLRIINPYSLVSSSTDCVELSIYLVSR